MINPFIGTELAKAHQRELLHEAEIERLSREARAGHSGLRDRLLSGIGSALAAMRQNIIGRATGATSAAIAPKVSFRDGH